MSDVHFIPHSPAAVVGDIVSAGAIVASFLGYVPLIAALFALVWYMIQIWESRTVQHWWRNRQMVKKAKKVARLKAKEKVIVAQLLALETLRQARVNARDMVETAKVDAAKIQIHEETEAVIKPDDPT
jgi:hypothetical protein